MARFALFALSLASLPVAAAERLWAAFLGKIYETEVS